MATGTRKVNDQLESQTPRYNRKSSLGTIDLSIFIQLRHLKATYSSTKTMRARSKLLIILLKYKYKVWASFSKKTASQILRKVQSKRKRKKFWGRRSRTLT